MKAAIYHRFGGDITIGQVPDPVVPEDAALIEVRATGICRSDWYGWQGHDADITLPHVPGHEWAGIVLETGSLVHDWKAGDRVTAPFICACGDCPQCHVGDQQVCPNQTQPGFTHWGSFAEYVVVRHADVNLVRLPEAMNFEEAASLGCRFGTAYRAVTAQSNLRPGDWLLVLGCGGVGLSALQLAHALDIRTIAVDIDQTKLDLAEQLGAAAVINSTEVSSLPEAVAEITNGGAHAAIDALGHPQLVADGILSVRKRGRHIQVGLMEGDHRYPTIPMARVIADEIEIVGSHGIQAHRYPDMFQLIAAKHLDVGQLISDTLSLSEGIRILQSMDIQPPQGIAVITHFD
ncbi:MAG: zinc-dependent alcohol dehydrogenase family protein [Saprospiraceae bacterium]|nr:zinc-dependent alcohol dehydrogenase family protein [Saprospiraceae bacterium]